jgi:uncharacterized delta-60 repeat protein
MPKLLNIEFSAITSVNSVSATTIQNVDNITYNDDGTNLLIGGQFKGFEGYTNFIVKVLPNGDIDSTFDMGDGFNGIVFNIEIDSNGDYYACGNFTSYKNTPANRIIKLLSNGDIDTTFNYGLGFNGQVRKITIQSDGKLLVGGNFNSYNGTNINGTINNIVRLNTDGSIDLTFKRPTSFTTLVTITDVSVDSTGKIYLCGTQLTNYSGVTVAGIVKLNNDGSIDNVFNYNNGFSINTSANKIAIDSFDKLYVGGSFTSYSGVTANRIIKLNSDGSIDSTFNYGTGFNNIVNNITIDSTGKLYVVGIFTTYNGATNTRIIKLNTDGSKDATFSSVNTFSINNASSINSVAINNLGEIFIGGQFTTYSLFFQNSIIKVNSTGGLDLSFNSFGAIGPNQSVQDIKFDSSNNLIIVGNFNAYKQPTNLESITAYNAKKNLSFNPNYGFNVSVTTTNIRVSSLLKSTLNNIYVGGYFENYTLLNSNYRAVGIVGLNLDGSPNPIINVNTGANLNVNEMYEDLSGGIFLLGQFNNYKGVGVPGVVKINPDASIDNSFSRAGLVTSSYFGMDFDSSNNIYLVGSFTTFSGQTNNRIVKLQPNGFKDNSFDNSIGFNSVPLVVKVDNLGKILLGGQFTTYKNVNANSIIRLNPDGSIDNTFNYGTGFNSTVSDIKIYNDKIYVMGNFSTYNGVLYRSLVRLNYDGTVDNTFRMKKGISNFPFNPLISIDSKGNLYIGGPINYQNYDSKPIIKIKPDGSLDVLFYLDSNNFKSLNLASTNFLSRARVIEI